MIDFNDIPERWAVCLNDKCPKAGECLRCMAYKEMPKTVTRWMCVMPSALQDGECKYFVKEEKIRMARGFRSLFDGMSSRDARHDLRLRLSEYFGSKGAYYRHKDGERLITPEQQHQIEALVEQYGYSAEAIFDEFVDAYDFKK